MNNQILVSSIINNEYNTDRIYVCEPLRRYIENQSWWYTPIAPNGTHLIGIYNSSTRSKVSIITCDDIMDSKKYDYIDIINNTIHIFDESTEFVYVKYINFEWCYACYAV